MISTNLSVIWGWHLGGPTTPGTPLVLPLPVRLETKWNWSHAKHHYKDFELFVLNMKEQGSITWLFHWLFNKKGYRECSILNRETQWGVTTGWYLYFIAWHISGILEHLLSVFLFWKLTNIPNREVLSWNMFSHVSECSSIFSISPSLSWDIW